MLSSYQMVPDFPDYNFTYPLTKLDTLLLSQDQKFYFPNQEKNIQTSRPYTYYPSVTNFSSRYPNSELASSDQQYLGMDDETRKNTLSLSLQQQNSFSPPSITNDDSTSSCCSISELALSDHHYLGAEDHDTASDQSPDSPKTPTNGPFNVNNNVNISYPWSLSTVYELSPPPDIISPLQSSPSLSTSSCYQRKSKEEIFLKFKLPKNGIATRTRSKKSIPNQDPPSMIKKKHHLSEEEKTLQKYSFKVADIPPFSRKVTLPSKNSQVINNLSKKNSNYPIPKTRSQILSNWTYYDQKKFLSFYLSEGKNFGQLAKSLNKSTKEVVEFYYYFKMSKEFRTAKSIKKELVNYSSKLEQINDSIIKLKHLSNVEKSISSPTTRVAPTRVTFAPSAI
ncbi:9297_t:CDS:2, partial [Rhizophagus irregularis]